MYLFDIKSNHLSIRYACILYTWSLLYFNNGCKNLERYLNPLSVNPTKWSNTLKQFVEQFVPLYTNMTTPF